MKSPSRWKSRSFSILFFALFISIALFIDATAHASLRAIFTPGDASAIIWLQGLSAMSAPDADARALFDQIAEAPSAVTGGQGKGVKTTDGTFVLSCVARPALPQDAMCSFVVKKSARTQVISGQQRALVLITDGEAFTLHEKLAGVGNSSPFLFSTQDGKVRIESTVERFTFSYN